MRQNEIYFPEEIRQMVGDEPYFCDKIGQSDSRVLMFEHLVLKIQPQTAETENEQAFALWALGKLPVPKMEAYLTQDGVAYTLMERVRGKMLCDDEWMRQPIKSTELMAEALNLLWSVDLRGCPKEVSPLEKRLEAARKNVESGLVDLDNVEPETFGEGGFASPEALLLWLENNRPDEEIVLTHGDFCLPNIFAENGSVSGFIDLGKAGPADRWQDIAIAARSLHHNFAGRYGDSYPGFDQRMLFDALGIKCNEEKNRYYLLLDELF